MDQLPVPVPPEQGDGTACRHENTYVTSRSFGQTLNGPYASLSFMWWIGKCIAYSFRKTVASAETAFALTTSWPVCVWLSQPQYVSVMSRRPENGTGHLEYQW